MFTKQKSILTAVTLTALLFISVANNSDADFEIVEFPSDTYDYSQDDITCHTAYLKTDVPFYSVLWYVDGNYAGYSYGGHEWNQAWFTPNPITGSIKGVKHTIEATAIWIEDDGTTHRDTESYTVRMFESIWLSETGESTGAYGYAEISRLYYNGTHIIMDSYTYAYNPTNNPKAKKPDDNPLIVAPWFWTQEYTAPDGDGGEERRSTKDLEIIKVGEGSWSEPGTLTDPDPRTGERKPFNREVGDLKGKKIYIKGHAHLQVGDGRTGVDNWEVDTQSQTRTAAVTFTEFDGP